MVARSRSFISHFRLTLHHIVLQLLRLYGRCGTFGGVLLKTALLYGLGLGIISHPVFLAVYCHMQ